MQTIRAGTTASLPPDFISGDTLGQKWVVILLKPDGSDDHYVALAGGSTGGWNVSAVNSPNITITVPLTAQVANYRIVCASVTNGNLTGFDDNILIAVTPPPPSNLLPAGSTRVFVLNGFDEPSQVYSAPGTEEPWEVIFTDPVSQAVSILASSQQPNGWAISRTGTKIYVHCPPGTVVSKGYEARIEVQTFF